jgi:hypothetical protein
MNYLELLDLGFCSLQVSMTAALVGFAVGAFGTAVGVNFGSDLTHFAARFPLVGRRRWAIMGSVRKKA